jgi:hypothetical protein
MRSKSRNRKPKVEPLSVAQEADHVINGPRRQAYGPVEDSFNRIASIWSGVLGITITGEQVSLCMIGLKLYRESNAHQRDNLVDLVGYTLLLDKLRAASRPSTTEG